MRRIRSRRKYTLRNNGMGFKGGEDAEFLEEESHFDEKGNLIRELKYESDNTGCEILEYEYNDKGDLIRQKMTAEGEMDIEETTLFERDNKGRLVNEVKYYGDDEGEKILVEYGAHDNPVRVSKSDPDGDPESEELMEYDSSDKLTRHHVKHFADGTETISVFTYDESSKPVKKVDTDKDGAVISIVEFHYNEQGLLARETESNENDETISEIITTYDDRENITERIIRDYNSRRLTFEFDKNDNCISEEVFDENGKMIMKTVFEFNEHNLPVHESSVATGIAFGVMDGNKDSRFEYDYYD
jgi:hypothetical protein